MYVNVQENIRALQRQDLKDYIRTHYTAPRMLVAGAGAIEHNELVELAQHYFANLPAAPPPGALIRDTAVFTGSHKRVKVRGEKGLWIFATVYKSLRV